MENELKIIADRGICKQCNMPNLIWQERRGVFRCGWCGEDYLPTRATELSRLTDSNYKAVMRIRKEAIQRAGKKGK